MGMKTMAMAVATVLMSASVAAADATTDIPPQPSALGNALAEGLNAWKHATSDLLEQAQKDDLQAAKLVKSMEERIKAIKLQRKDVEAAQKANLNASVKLGKSAKGDEEKKQQAADLKKAADNLKAANT